MVEWLVILTVCLPWLGALAVWSVGDRRPRLQHGLASGFAMAAGVSSLALLPVATDQVVLNIPAGGIFGEFSFVPDGLAVLLATIASVVGSLAVIFSIDYMRDEPQLGRYYALVLLFIGAMSGLVLSGSLLLMFFFWEITAFCSYALISFHNDDPKAVYGGIKALIVTQVGGVGLLSGALITHAFLGSYQVNSFLANAHTLPQGALGWIAFGCLAAAVAKSAQIPLHTWLPDAMEAPTPVTALIHAATMVNAGVYLLARFYPAFASVPGWSVAVITIGLISALLAGFMAATAVDLKRALAYSTISQLGFMFYAVGVGAIFASQFHLLSHALFKGLLFLSAGAVIQAVGTRDMRQMGGLSRRMPFVHAVFLIGALALAGIPITNGFFSKELVLEGGLRLGPLWAYMLMLFGTGLTALYTTRIVSMLFYGRSEPARCDHDGRPAMRVSLGLLAMGSLTAWMLAAPFSQMLAHTLPYHNVSSTNAFEVVVELLISPATALVMAVVCLGIVAWTVRDRPVLHVRLLKPLTRLAEREMGFEWLNDRLRYLVQEISTASCRTQTGQLNWNVSGLVGGLIILLAILTWGTR